MKINKLYFLTVVSFVAVIFFVLPLFVASATTAPSTQADKDAAIATAKLFVPAAGTNCLMVLTPAVHTATGALYTFTSSCLAPGWVVATTTAPSTQADKDAAIAAAKLFVPAAGISCAAVLTPAVHTVTGALYTFPSACLAPGWVVATTVIPVAPSGYVVLKKGDTGIKVKALQIKLIRVGFSVVTSSSTFDSATETALKTFQTNNALESNGTLDWVTNVVLNKAAANSRKIVAKLNDNNDTVKTINANLKLLSFTPDEGSLFGPNTQKAVMAFQLKYKIGVTGMMDGRTNRKLISEVKIVTKEAEDVSKGIKADSKKSLILRYQDYLNKLGYTITADGVYGDTTIAAVKDFQGKNKNLISGQTLTVNGIINTETQKVINAQIKELKKQMRADLAVLREEVNSDEALQKIIIEWEEKNPGYRLAVTPNGDIVVTKD